jgi:pimeloyl-ACP methyl ester carboxylesterase
MRTAYRAAAVVVAILFLGIVTRVAHYQNGVPPHQDQYLPGGEPATFYLPGSSNQPGPGNPFFQTFPKSAAERPPAVVLIHGFSSDRVNSSALARRIAQNGYGVLAIDVRGHGENRNSFVESQTGHGLREDVKNAVEFLRQSNLVDGSRIVVMGHSMGAGAALDYATHDPNLKGSVMISGGFNLEGPEHPRNTLFIFAENDPEFIKETSLVVGAHLACVPKLELGKVYGDVANGTAVEAIQVPGVDHVRIIWSADAAASIVRWLDNVCGVKRAGDPNLAEPRLTLILLCLPLFIFLLIPIGRVCGGITPMWERNPSDATGWLGLVALAIALFAAMALNANAPQADFLSIFQGHVIISWLAIAGALLVTLLAIQRPDDLRRLGNGAGATLLAAALAFGAIVVINGSYEVALHRTALTPERLLVTLASALLILPFFVSFELLLRRGTTTMATVLGSLGRVLLVVTIVIGLGLGTIPFVLSLVLPVFVILFVMFEVFAASVYSVSGNLLLIALVESLWFARTAALSWPITFKF